MIRWTVSIPHRRSPCKSKLTARVHSAALTLAPLSFPSKAGNYGGASKVTFLYHLASSLRVKALHHTAFVSASENCS